MNDYRFDNCDIGTKESFTVVISDKMMSSFCALSGDENPMHMDKDYAQQHGYDDRLAYGLLTSSFYSTLVGMYLPGRYCILKTIEVYFERPAYIGDTITVVGRVTEKDDRFNQITVRAKNKNQFDKTISKAKIIVGFYE